MVSPAEVLSWRGGTSVHQRLRERYAALSRERFEQLLADFDRGRVGTTLRSLVDELPERSRSRLILAPESGRRLHHGPHLDLRFFLSGALAERRRSDPAVVLDQPVWSALGDCHFPVGDAPSYAAPRLAAGMPVDHVSPHAAATLWETATRPYAAADLREVVTLLDTAMDLLRRVSADAYALIVASVQVVVVRRDPAGTVAAYSTDRCIGRPVFRNLHPPCVDLAETVDRLLHEAVHSFLYLVEVGEPLLTDRSMTDEVVVASPWTGRRLQLHSFAHACHVWFALWMFWRLAEAAALFPAGRAAALAARARRGFDTPAMRSALRTARPYLTVSGQRLLALADDVSRGYFD